MVIDGKVNVVDDVSELLAFVRSNFKGSESSKVEEAFDLWEDGMVDHALEHFELILRKEKNSSNEKIVARVGILACSTKQKRTEKVLFSLSMILSIFGKSLFLENLYFFKELRESEISSEKIDAAIEVLKRIIVIVEKFEIKTQKAGENENNRVSGVIRISARINLAKLQIFQEIWEDALENILQVEELAKLRNKYEVLPEIYSLIIRLYHGLEGENSDNVQRYWKKHFAALSVIAQVRSPREY